MKRCGQLIRIFKYSVLCLLSCVYLLGQPTCRFSRSPSETQRWNQCETQCPVCSGGGGCGGVGVADIFTNT